ncbi:hypothetical protein [Cupriavidus sp. HPC(L)]|uniref:hypothetical protein n=1 Tax=Cupriavidus sp. HPC(L) TaxID=1217418 RepID=UPI0012ED24B9|nr:hypothetical protein [Cupriavidus sp. HPC(L)]
MHESLQDAGKRAALRTTWRARLPADNTTDCRRTGALALAALAGIDASAGAAERRAK